jgi:hypothetical protein
MNPPGSRPGIRSFATMHDNQTKKQSIQEPRTIRLPSEGCQGCKNHDGSLS